MVKISQYEIEEEGSFILTSVSAEPAIEGLAYEPAYLFKGPKGTC